MSYLSEILADSPTSFWRLNDPTGSYTAPDLGSANNELDYSGGTSATFQVPGPISTDSNSFGVRFPAIPKYVSMYEPTYTKVWNNGSFSAAIWFRTTTLLTTINRIFGLGDLPPPSTSISYLFWLGVDGTVRASIKNSHGITRTLTSTVVVTDGVWRRFVMTYDASVATFKFYINKTLIGTDALPSDYYGAGITASTYFRIGSHDTLNRITADYADGALWLGSVLPESRIIAQYDAATSGTVNPSSGGIVISGGIPTISQPKSISPSSGGITISGGVPSVVSEIQIQPIAGGIIVGGEIAQVLQPREIEPAPGGVVITGGVPDVYNPVLSGAGAAQFSPFMILSRYGNTAFWYPGTQVIDDSFTSLIAASAALATATGELSTMSGELAGAAQTEATATGYLYTPEIIGAAQVVASASGNLSSLITMASIAGVESDAAGKLDVLVQIASAANALATASASLQQKIALAGMAAGEASASAMVEQFAALAATASAISQATGVLGTTAPLDGSATAEASASGALGAQIGLAGSAGVVVSADALPPGQDVSLGGSATAQAAASGRLLADMPVDGGITYAVNIATGAATTLSNFGFDRLMSAHRKLYGVRDGVLYVVGGDADPNETAIDAAIRFAPSHYGAIGSKRLETVYCYSRELAGLLVTPIYDETASIEYITTPLNRDGMRATRAFVGRGNSWHTLGFEVKNQGGGKLDIGGLEPVISLISRKRR